MVIKIKAKDKLGVYRDYINFLHPVFKVSPQELDVLSRLMLKYNEISDEVDNRSYVNKLLFSTETRDDIAESMDMSKVRYDGILSKFRTMGLMKGRELSSKIIPKIKDNKVTINVEIHEEQNI